MDALPAGLVCICTVLLPAEAEAAKAAADLDREEEVLQRAEEIRAARDAFARPMPPAPEPKRPKVHWDFLLEEMTWLAKEFAKWVICRSIHEPPSSSLVTFHDRK